MKEKRFLRIFGQIDGRFIEEADPFRKRSARRVSVRRAALIAAALALVIAGGALLGGRGGNVIVPAARADYEPDYGKPYDGAEISEAYITALRAFAARAGQALLDADQTTAYSPAALYSALSMTAEMAEGEYLEAILSALGVGEKEILYDNSGNLWRYLCANPAAEAPGKVMVANSLWLNQEEVFREDTLLSLADNYYTACFVGDMMNEIPAKAQRWVEEKTGGLLAADLKPDKDTLAALYSALYFYDEWAAKFTEGDVTSGWFHCAEADSVPCNYLRREQSGWAYYQGEGVTASAQYFAGGGKMLFILPDEGVSPGQVLENEGLLTGLLNWETLEKRAAKVRWRIPRFAMKDTIDLREGLTALGLGCLFDRYQNSLSRLCVDSPAYIASAEQGTAIAINETGCEAASYAQIMIDRAAGMPEMEQTVDMYLSRPFVFAILSDNDVPLFLGVINNPNG